MKQPSDLLKNCFMQTVILKNGINKINDFKLIIILNVAMVIMLLFFQIPGISDSGRFTYNVSELGGEGPFFY